MMKSDIHVGVIGFATREQDRLKRIFQYSGSRGRSYVAGDLESGPIDILMVNVDSSEAEDQRQHALQKFPEIQIITTSLSQPANDSSHHIRGALISTRVLKVLEQVEIQETQAETLAEAQQQPETLDPQAETLPEAEQTNQSDAPEQPQTEQNQDQQSFDVLVVDDSPAMQKALEIELEQVPIALNIDYADTGEQALERIAQKTYHFIFLDIMMPGIDGFETCTTIRKNPEMKKTPIIMLSSKTSPMDEVKGVMAGCTTYLTKPIIHDDFQKLIIRIMEWLENFQQK